MLHIIVIIITTIAVSLLDRSYCLSTDFVYIVFVNPVLSGTSVAPTSEVYVSTMLLLLRKLKLTRLGWPPVA
jgi:hypothetical protein